MLFRSNIINIDYLTAEPYAEDFHCLKSGTRSINVKKINFMPGFTNKTGGLILNDKNAFAEQNKKDKNVFSILIFSYKRNFSSILNDINSFQKIKKEENKNFKVKVFLAPGIGKSSFIKDFEKCKNEFELCELPFMAQNEWDNFLLRMDFIFIRGEDSLTRACLSGIPFVWHAYKQEDDYQTVKVKALLDLMKVHFSEKDFTEIEDFYLWYNKDKREEKSFLNLLLKSEKLKIGFTEFSEKLKANGNFTSHLLDFIATLKSN